MQPANRFLKGSAVYTCGCCGRRTRATGRGDNEHSGLCAECYDLAGIENLITDEGIENVDPAYLADARQLHQAILAKGGSYTLEYPEILTA